MKIAQIQLNYNLNVLNLTSMINTTSKKIAKTTYIAYKMRRKSLNYQANKS